MPYVVHKSGSGYKVFKKSSSKSFSKKPMTKEKAREQQKALYASETANESLDTSKVGSNLEFKGIYPAVDHQEASAVYKVKSERNTNLTIVYSLGQTAEDADYKYLIVRDLNDPKGRPHRIEDPHSEESKKLLAIYNLTPDDIEMAGQDGYDKIAEHLSKENTTENSFEESLEFENLIGKILNNEEEQKI